MDFAAARTMMVDSQVRVNDVTDRALQAAMLAVPRERFCAPDRAFSAYAEVECEIAGGRVLMLPREAAKLLSAVEARPGETALAIGAPYAGAVLARLGAKVTAQEANQAVLDVVAPALADAGVETVVAAVRSSRTAKDTTSSSAKAPSARGPRPGWTPWPWADAWRWWSARARRAGACCTCADGTDFRGVTCSMRPRRCWRE